MNINLFIANTIAKTLRVSWTLFKLMIPVIVIFKILSILGAIEIISNYINPLMEFVGLPGSMGIVWATSLITGLYPAIIVFLSLVGEGENLTYAQTTILATMILVAHNIPVECRIAQGTGLNIFYTIFLRCVSAVIVAYILNYIYNLNDFLQDTYILYWFAGPLDSSFSFWIISQLKSFLLIFSIILVLTFLLEILKITGAEKILIKFLAPIFQTIGIGREAATITVIGITLGVSLGGGFLIDEVKQNNIRKKDVLSSMTFLLLSHSLIEDTLVVMALMGGHFSGVLVARVLYSIVIVWFVVALLKILNNNLSNKLFFKS